MIASSTDYKDEWISTKGIVLPSSPFFFFFFFSSSSPFVLKVKIWFSSLVRCEIHSKEQEGSKFLFLPVGKKAGGIPVVSPTTRAMGRGPWAHNW